MPQSKQWAEVVRVDLPKKESQGEHYHTPGAPCGGHLTETYYIAADDLAENWEYTACSGCIEHHGLEEYHAN